MKWTPYNFSVATMGPLVVLANLPVVISSGLLVRGGIQPKPTYMLLGNVALADLITALSILFGAFFPKEGRSFDICILQLGAIVMCTMCSMVTVCLIAVERYLYIVQGIHYDSYLKSSTVYLMIVGSWFASVLYAFLPAILAPQYTGPVVAHCWFVDAFPPEALMFFTVFATTAVLLVLILYTGIYLTARRAAGGSVATMKFRSVLVVFMSSAAFAITWCPYLIGVIVYIQSCTQGHTSNQCGNIMFAITTPLPAIGFLNSLLNPLIYAWWHKPFYEAVKKLFCPKSYRENQRLQALAGAKP